jgi:hypothetical protein
MMERSCLREVKMNGLEARRNEGVNRVAGQIVTVMTKKGQVNVKGSK